MPSRHSAAQDLIIKRVFDDLSSFRVLEDRISALGDENSKAVGDALEIFVEAYLATQPIAQCEECWLVGQIPLQIRRDLILPDDAKGIDGVYRTKHASLVPYQVKFRSRRAYLTFSELAGFIGVTDRAEERVVFTNSNELADDISRRPGLRVVRGIDFDRLEPADFQAIEAWLKEKPVPKPKRTPRDYQEVALRDISACLSRSDRAHVVMACGTGKTLVALWSAERLGARQILVLLPSLSLLRQTLQEWSSHNGWGADYSYICVCSDRTVSRGSDEIQIDPSEIDFRVDTDPAIIEQFLKSPSQRVRVVFSTYQSSPVISQAMANIKPFDIAIFDEAHKTTGPAGTTFATALSDDKINIRKRLFFTATPRHYDINRRDEEGDFKFVSMDDEFVYGPRAHTLTFSKAAKAGIICDYKVIIPLINKKQVNDFAFRNGLTLVDGDVIGIKWVANELAVQQAVEKTNASRVITFHSRVKLAEEFASDASHGIKRHLNDFSVFHVNGEQRSSDREDLLHAFRDARKGLITNARCLTEGIDVPAVDMVAFIDPRQSKIDIVQATGRAMRKSDRTNKTLGYVVVPLFIDADTEDDIDAKIGSGFEEIVAVLNALQEQDDDLVDIIRTLREDQGRGEVFNPRALREKIEFIGAFVSLEKISDSISVRIVDRIGSRWDEMYGRLIMFQRTNGDCLVPYEYRTEDGCRVGLWVGVQRRNKDKMDPDRRRRLEALPGWSWDPLSDQWEEGLSYLKEFSEREGHSQVPLRYKTHDDYRLGVWVGHQRKTRDKIDPERQRRLEALPGWSWDPFSDQWEEWFSYLIEFSEREGHCRVPVSYKTEHGFGLGQWAANQRKDRNKMDPDRRRRLEALPRWSWDLLSDKWEEGFSCLKAFSERGGHCLVPGIYKTEDGYRIGQWVAEQRKDRDKMDPERQRRLEGLLGWTWDAFSDRWEEGFSSLKEFAERKGHCLVPSIYKTEGGYGLGKWISDQRKRRDKMDPDRRRRLEALPGWSWHRFSDQWEQGFSHLKEFSEREGHCRVTNYKTENGYRLGSWVQNQRNSRDKIDPERQRRLEGLLGWSWDPFSARWEEAFSSLKKFAEREGHCRVASIYKAEDGYGLGQWVLDQRVRKEKMDPDRRRRLEALPGWTWDALSARWEERFSSLKKFSEREGHCRVPQDYYTDDGYQFGVWVGRQRKTRDKIDPERQRRLEGLLGWSWDPLSDQWEEGFSCLKEFSEREGHSQVPKRYTTDEDYPLGVWIVRQRVNRDEVDPDRRRRLEALPGWSWDPFSDQWEEGFSYLREFLEREGHCRVPQHYKAEDSYPLGLWVGRQRSIRDKMDPDRRRRLEELPGWLWKVKSDV